MIDVPLMVRCYRLIEAGAARTVPELITATGEDGKRVMGAVYDLRSQDAVYRKERRGHVCVWATTRRGLQPMYIRMADRQEAGA
mgnify:FL=1